MKRNQYNDLDAGLGYFLALATPIIIGLIFSIIFGLIANRLGLNNYTDSPVLYSIYFCIISLSFLGIFLAYNKAARINAKNAGLFKFKFGWKNLVFCIIIAFVTLFGFNSLINYLFFLLEKIGYSPDTSLPLPLTNGWWLIINLFALAIIPAVCEEVIYRGIILNGFRRFGTVNAILISSLFFALAHGSAMQFFYQFILGIVLGFVLIKTGSIFASMLVHFLNNATVIVFNFVTKSQSEAVVYSVSDVISSFTLAIAAAGVLILLIYWLKEKKSVQISCNEEYNNIYKNKQKSFSSVHSRLIFWLSIIISVVLWSIGTFLR